ncbi:VanZ family protein [Chitinophaga sp. RAB17]|uniref:VanZ family protein n=1 Tax=Chitinophaga sp. RAB17 TaxID=3233049 RepID=UPI003F910233
MNKRSIYITLLIIILAFTLFEEVRLRPYLIKHHITTLFLADSLPNFLAVVVLFLGYSVIKFPLDERKTISTIVSVVVGLSLYELCQLWMPQRTFDIKDVVASVLGGAFSYLIFRIVNTLKPSTPSDN